MVVDYKGFEIDVARRESVAGDTLLYFSVFRKADMWELTSGFSEGSDPVREWVHDMKKLVDEYLENPEEYEDDL